MSRHLSLLTQSILRFAIAVTRVVCTFQPVRAERHRPNRIAGSGGHRSGVAEGEQQI